MPVFEYICSECGKTVEMPKLLAENSRHMKDTNKVCGVLKRNWKAVNINTANLRSARG